MRRCRPLSLRLCCCPAVRWLVMELRDLKTQFALRLLRFAGYALCIGALGAGLYARWLRDGQNAWILGVALVALSLFLIAVALRYYFRFVAVEEALSGVSLTFLVGFIALTADQHLADDGAECTMNWLLMVSSGVRLLCAIVARAAAAAGLRTGDDDDGVDVGGRQLWPGGCGRALLPARCGWTAIGMLLAVFSVTFDGGTTEPVACLATLLAALIVHLCAVRIGSRLAAVALAGHLCAANYWLLPRLLGPAQFNPFVLAYFVADLFTESLVDLATFGGDELERSLRPLVGESSGGRASARLALQRVLLVASVVAQLFYMSLAAATLPAHKEWFVVSPLYAALVLILWGPFRIVLLVVCWQLVNRLHDCWADYHRLHGGGDGSSSGSGVGDCGRISASSGSMADVMAAKGVRHFALTCTRPIGAAVLSSPVPLLIAWTTLQAQPLAVAVFLLVLPYECAALSLLRLLGDRLGGTCCGYAAIGSPSPAIYPAPNTGTVVQSHEQYRPGESVTLLSPAEAERMVSRSQAILGLVCKFFAHHLIDNATGCDCSTAPLTADYVAARLKEFFARTSPEGRSFDTYVLYYSGPVHSSGDWALAGNGELKYDDLMNLWRESAAFKTSRIVVVLDTLRSGPWLASVRKSRDARVALQTASLGLFDAESSLCSTSVGDFTRDWVNYNCGVDSSIYGNTYVSPIVASYAVSRPWTSFRFSEPTREEVGRHWDSSFPRIMKPLKLVVSCPNLDSLTCCCSAVWNWLLRCRMSLFQPALLDTGHGFKLVRFSRMR